MRIIAFLMFCLSFALCDVTFHKGVANVYFGYNVSIYINKYDKNDGHMFYDGEIYYLREFELSNNQSIVDVFSQSDKNITLNLKFTNSNLIANINGNEKILNLVKSYSIIFAKDNEKDDKFSYFNGVTYESSSDIDFIIIKEFLNSDYTMTKNIYENEKIEFGEAVNQTFYTKEIFYQKDDILVLVGNSYTYSGGAHGYGASIYSVYDGKEELKFEDIFTNLDRLKDIIWSKIKDFTYIEKQNLKVTKNYYISPYGIGFVYQPYEVAAYVYGNVKVKLNWYEISKSLTDKGKELFLR